LLKEFILLFSELYDRLERARWDMNSVPMDRIDKSKIDVGMIHDIKHVTLTELGAVPATRMFMRDFALDIDFQRFVAVWSFEEAKHSLVLERWLRAIGEEIPEADMVKVNIEFEPAPWIETLAMHFLGEQKLGMWYAAFCGIGPGTDVDKALKEPVLKQCFKLMAQDEWRHAGCYFAFLKEAVATQPEYLENIGKMMLWMLRGRYRHPTNITTPSVLGQLPDPGYFDQMLDRAMTTEAEKAMEKRVLSCYGILTGQEIQSQKDIAKYLRNKFGARAAEQIPA